MVPVVMSLPSAKRSTLMKERPKLATKARLSPTRVMYSGVPSSAPVRRAMSWPVAALSSSTSRCSVGSKKNSLGVVPRKMTIGCTSW